MTVPDNDTLAVDAPAVRRPPPASAVTQVFITNRRALHQMVTRIVGCACLAEDVLQDAFLKLCSGPPEPGLRCEIGYVGRVVRNLALDFYRRQQVERRLFTAADPEHDMPLDDNSPDCILSARQRNGCVRAAMRALPPRTRDALTQYYFEEQTQQRIAERLGISTTMVHFILQDARHALTSMNLAR